MRNVLFFLFALFAFSVSVVPAAQDTTDRVEEAVADPVQSSTEGEDNQELETSPVQGETTAVKQEVVTQPGVEATERKSEFANDSEQDPVGDTAEGKSKEAKDSVGDQFETTGKETPVVKEPVVDTPVNESETIIDSGSEKVEAPGKGHEVQSDPHEPKKTVAEKKQTVRGAGPRRTKSADLKSIAGYINQLDQLNQKVADIEDESDIKKLLDRENEELTGLIALLRTTDVDKLPSAVNRREIDFLNSRIAINQERGNELAVQRDQVKLAYYKVTQGINDYIEFLIRSSKNFEGIDGIVGKSVETRAAFEQISKDLSIPTGDLTGTVAQTLEKNYLQLRVAEDTFQDILTFVINNPGLIASTHWFQKFTLISAISFVNSFDFIKPVNFKLSPFRVDAGGIIVSLVIFALVFLTYPVVFKCSSWMVENYILYKTSESAELIYHELRKPVRFLMVFIGIDLATYALLYKAKYRFENLAFIIYALIFVWFIFKVLDSVVIAHFEKISKTNKELRKDLVKLSIQLTKFVILIIVLAVLLNHFGVNITALMSTLGIGGVAFAFAAKDSIANLFGGITILFDNMFKMGDWVKIDDVEGTVAEIGLRSTTIRTFDNALVTVPNSQISISSVINWDRRAVGRRIKMYIGVTYESNMDDIRNALEDIRTMLTEHPDIANPKQKHTNRTRQFRLSSHEDTQGIKSTQLVFMDRYNDYSIDLLIYCFSRTVNWADWLAVKEDVLFKIADILKKNNLEFAYPTHVMKGDFSQFQLGAETPS